MSGDRVNIAIPSFINGVSQQPAATRLLSQCAEQVNGYSSVVDGLRKRPPTRHIARLMAGQHGGAFVHVINRDLAERYVVVIAGGNLRVFDILNGGQECTVLFPNGKSYLTSNLPNQDFAMATVADHSFIVNKRIKTAMSSARTPAEVNEAIVYVKRGYVNTSYKVMVGTTWVTHATPNAYSQLSADGKTTTNVGTQPSTEDIANSLASGIRNAGFSVDTLGSCLRIRRSNGSDFAFKVTDSWGEEALVGIKREVQKFTDLPAKCWDGVTVRVVGENTGREDDYYVCYNSEGATKNGIWEECRGWNQQYAFNAATMPHLLVREADGAFTFRQALWDEAGVGDDASAEPPSFIGTTIEDVFFFRNRLGLIADENVVLTRHGGYYNFWPQTATTLLATDPIDVACNGSSHPDKVSLLRHGVPYKDVLLLFSDQTQFQLSDGGATAMSPETVRADPVTEYESSGRCRPVGAGRSVFFITESGNNSAVREYIVMDDSTGADAKEITSHIPRYIPKNVHRMIASSNEDVLMVLSGEAPNEIFVYKYFWVEDEKAQSSWSRWVFPQTDAILSISNIEAEVYLVVERPDGVYLDKVDLQSTTPDGDLNFQIHLDRRVTVTGSYTPTEDEVGFTTWTLPYADTEPLALVLGSGCPGRGGQSLAGLTQSGTTLTAPGNFAGFPCIAGRQYEFRYTFSEQHMRESRDVGAPVIKDGRLQLLNFTVLHHDSGYFRSEVTSKGRDPVVKPHLGTIGDLHFRIGVPVIDSVPHRFGVLAKSDQVKIEIVNDMHYPSNFQSAEWTGTFVADARRV